MTIACHNCHRQNPVGRGFCQHCGSRLALPKTAFENSDRDEEHERATSALRQELNSAQRERDAANEELKVLKLKAGPDAPPASETKTAADSLLRESLAKSEKTIAALQIELEAAKSRHGATESQIKEQLTAGHLTISSLKQDIEAAKEKVAAEFREKLAAGERAVASLKQRYAGVEESLRAHQEKIAQKETLLGERNAEEARLRDRLAESEKSLAALRLELDAVKSPLDSGERELREQASTGPESVAPQGDLDAARTAIAAEFNDKIAAGEAAIAALKQQHSSATEQIARDHQDKLAQKETVIEQLKAKLQDFAALEKKMLASAGHALVATPPGQPATTTRRTFGATALSIAAALSMGTGGVAGYLWQPSSASENQDQATVVDLQGKLAQANKINRDLEDGLRSQHEAYERINADLKRAEADLNNRPPANNGGSDELQRQLQEARALQQQQQNRLAAFQADVERSKQDIASRDQTIAQLNQELQDAKSQDSKSQDAKARDTKDVRPRPRQSFDLDTTIRNLERDYGIPRIGR
jgi:DNA repair exonuclease SbcCD ATPase subunit